MPRRSAIGLALCAAGCHVQHAEFHEGTPGQLGRTWSTYMTCFVTGVRCGTGDGALAEGTRSLIRVESLQSVASVESNNHAIVEVLDFHALEAWPGEFQFHAVAHRSGMASVTFYDERQQPIDRTSLTVAAPVAVTIQTAFAEPTVIAQSPVVLQATPMGRDGHPLLGIGSVRFAFGGVLGTTPADRMKTQEILDEAFLYPDSIQFTAMMPGKGAVTVSVASSTASILIHAVGVETVDEMSLSTDPVHMILRETAIMSYQQRANGVNVYGSSCQWSVLDPSIVSVTNEAPYLTWPDSAEYVFNSRNVGHTKAICAMNTFRKEVEIDVEDRSAP